VPVDCRKLLDLMLAKRPADRLYDGDAVIEALKALSEGRIPTLHPERFNDGGTTDVGEVDEEFEDAATEGDIATNDERVAPTTKESPQTSARRPLIRRRRR
jgi:hypothetical protein